MKLLGTIVNVHKKQVVQKQILEKAYADYENREEWAKKMLVNISKAGFFSSDRTISQYNDEIWHLSEGTK